MQETPTHSLWLGCMVILCAFSTGVSIGLVVMFLFTR